MHRLYTVVFTLGFIFALPYFLFQALFHRKYLSSLCQRLGELPDDVKRSPKGGIWVHAVSVGEVLAILPLVNALQLRWPDRSLFVSTTTLTGQTLARNKLLGKVRIFYFPLDWLFAVRASLSVVRPAVVLIAETEIWPNFLRECRNRRIPVLLVNGRLSDRSLAGYRLIRRFMKRVLGDFRFCCMQTPVDRDRLMMLGASPEKVAVCGNLKYEIALPEDIDEKIEFYRRLLNLDSEKFVVVAGSTMKGEEPLVLAAFKALRSECSQAVLILAPRHPERFREVEALLSGAFAYRRRSAMRPGDRDSGPVEVILLDSMGELASLYALADLVFIGGSLVPTGGHNILEPAVYRRPVLFGPHMNNFREMAECFLERQAAVRVGNARELGEKFLDLFHNAGLRRHMGENGHAILGANRGVVQTILKRVELEIMN
jgi:3-deoxy-D-manno-octulosonic-acid transferase